MSFLLNGYLEEGKLPGVGGIQMSIPPVVTTAADEYNMTQLFPDGRPQM